MTSIEIQDFLNIYSMFTFKDGRKEPGLIISRYNTIKAEVEYHFIPQIHMQTYKIAFEKFDRETCAKLTEEVKCENLSSIRPVSLSDYKMIMELMHERNRMLNAMR